MSVALDRCTIRVAVDEKTSEPGLLVFVEGALVAVFSELRESAADGRVSTCWVLEAGFGRCEYVPAPPFNSREEAEGWALECYSRAASL